MMSTVDTTSLNLKCGQHISVLKGEKIEGTTQCNGYNRDYTRCVLRNIDGSIFCETHLRETLISLLFPIVKILVRRYSRKFPTFKDDFESVASLAICRAMHNIHKMTHDNCVGYVTRYIQGALYLFIRKQLPHLNLLPIENDIELKEKTITLADILDSIARAPLKHIEHEVLMHYLTNLTDLEISEKLNLTRQRIQQMRIEIFEKIKKVFESNQI